MHTKSFNDKIVLVTGGSKGIGLACAKQFVGEGARVVISSRSQANIDEALKMLPALPPISPMVRLQRRWSNG